MLHPKRSFQPVFPAHLPIFNHKQLVDCALTGGTVKTGQVLGLFKAKTDGHENSGSDRRRRARHSRAGGGVAKQWRTLSGRRVIAHGQFRPFAMPVST